LVTLENDFDHCRHAILRVRGNLDCNDAELLHRWAAKGLGLVWRSTREIPAELLSGALVTALDDYAIADYSTRVVYPQRRNIPAKVRLLIEHSSRRMQRRSTE